MGRRALIVGAILTPLFLFVAACSAAEPEETTVPPTPTPYRPVTRDAVYATGLGEEGTQWVLDVYAADGGQGRPVVVFLYGLDGARGYFKDLYATAVENEVVLYEIEWPTHIFDMAAREDGAGYREMSEIVTCAIRYARATAADFGGDADEVILSGFSMGAIYGSWIGLGTGEFESLWEEFAQERGGPPAQVACVEGDVPARVTAFIGIGGQYEYVERLQNRDPEMWDIISPFQLIGRDPDLKVRLLAGKDDLQAVTDQSERLNQALSEAGYDTQLIRYDGKHEVPAELTIAEIHRISNE